MVKTLINESDKLHVPVLPEEVIANLSLSVGDVVADLTVGAGGHSEMILNKIGKTGRLLAIDRDSGMVEKVKKKFVDYENVDVVCERFSKLGEIADDYGYSMFDAILLDLGVSSWQIDDNNRGFSYLSESKLDMRMGAGEKSAAEVLNSYPQEDLENIFKDFGDISRARTLAKKVASFRRAKSFIYVSDLKNLVEGFSSFREKKRNILGRVWQALRIEVNDEYNELKKVLRVAVERLNKGGKLAVISFHSGEDRIVKSFFRDMARCCICPKEFPQCRCGHRQILKVITKRPITPGKKELVNNIRSHSAKMRVVSKN